MKFGNYLAKFLVDSRNFKNKEEICLSGCDKLIKEIYLDIKDTISKDSIKFFSQNLNVSYQTLYCWVNGSNPIPVSKVYSLVDLWAKVCNKRGGDVSFKIDEIFNCVVGYSQNGQRRVILPRELNSDIGYLIGYFQGDGHLASTEVRGFKQYSLHFYDSNKGVLLKIEELMKKEFLVKGNFYFNSDKNGSWFTLRFTSKPVYLFFEKDLGLKSGRKTLNVGVPEVIREAEDSVQLVFVRGFFDAEGAVGETKKNPWLDIGQASRGQPSEVLVWIHNKLASKGISFSLPQKVSNQEFFRLRTAKRETIKRFFDIVGSNHPKKVARFQEIIKNVKR